jgi:phenylpyruvate tautomerase PptA (4-oxalocrotonate tautomerase family)
MPHLQFELTESVSDSEAQSFVLWVTDLYSDVMDTGTGHIGVTIRDEATIALGRADPDKPVAFLNGDIRAGRSFEQRRELAVTIMDELADRWGVPTENTYVIYTEHPGEDFLLREGALDSWSAKEGDGGSDSAA